MKSEIYEQALKDIASDQLAILNSIADLRMKMIELDTEKRITQDKYTAYLNRTKKMD